MAKWMWYKSTSNTWKGLMALLKGIRLGLDEGCQLSKDNKLGCLEGSADIKGIN